MIEVNKLTAHLRVDIDYTNYEGKRYQRRVQPVEGGFHFNYNSYHPDPQWLLTAIDISGDGTLKTFAMKQVHSWVPAARGSSPPIKPPRG